MDAEGKVSSKGTFLGKPIEGPADDSWARGRCYRGGCGGDANGGDQDQITSATT